VTRLVRVGKPEFRTIVFGDVGNPRSIGRPGGAVILRNGKLDPERDRPCAAPSAFMTKIRRLQNDGPHTERAKAILELSGDHVGW